MIFFVFLGRGTKVLGPGSIVSAEMTIRCKSLATAKDPGGLQICFIFDAIIGILYLPYLL